MPTDKELSQLNIFLVGGAVRDGLLKRKVIDQDFVVVGSSSEQMLSLGFTPVGKDFPVFLHPKTKEEFALARTERKQGLGYTGFTCYAAPEVTLEEDLLRRDLTVNAMAMDDNGLVIDPYNGQQDLEHRILRHVSPAFIEDPLRVLRVARFAARYHEYGFTVAEETMALMTEISLSGELKSLTPERVWQEMHKSLTEPHPQVFFNTLRQCQALKEIWPDLDALWGIPNPERWHPEICSGLHSMMALEQAVLLSTKTTVRFAVLCHDLGKGLTPENELPSHKGHETTGLPLVEKACLFFKVPNNYKQLALKVCQFHLHCHKAFELKPSTLLKVFNQVDLWRKPEEFEDFLLACEADFKGRLNFEAKPYPQAEYLRGMATLALGVNAKTYIDQGIKGKAIKEAMDKDRIAIMSDFKQKTMSTSANA